MRRSAEDVPLPMHRLAQLVRCGEVTPLELARTAVGACIVEVGLGTRFPPQADPIAFKIPVQVKTSRGGGQ